MRIAFFSFGILEHSGGLEKYYIEVSQRMLAFSENEVAVITMDDAATHKMIKMLSLFYLKKIELSAAHRVTEQQIKKSLGKVKYYKISSLSKLRERLNEYDVIYVKNELIETTLLRCVGYKRLPPVILGCHTPIYYPVTASWQAKLHNRLYNGNVYKFLAQGAKAFHVLNSSDASRIRDNFPTKSTYNIVNPFPIDKFLRLSRKKNNSFDKTQFNILWAGRLTAQKGVKDLKKIIDRVNSTNPSMLKRIRWNIAGDGIELYVIKSLLSRWDNISYFGHVDSRNMASMYKSSDLFISTSHWEGLPYNVIEATALGVPVVSYNIPGCRDLIVDKESGLLVADVKEFVDGVINSINGEQEYRSNAPFIESRFGLGVYDQLQAMFEEVIRRNYEKT